MTYALRRIFAANLTTQILTALVVGTVFGVVLNYLDLPFLQDHLVNGLFLMVGQMFLNGLQMLVVPLVVFSLLCGVVGIGDLKVLGRVGGLTFVIYVATTALAVATALFFANLINPGTGFTSLHLADQTVSVAPAETAWHVLANIVPKNPIHAFANGEMLQIIFYVIVVGIAVLMIGQRAKSFVEGCTFLNELAMKIVQIVMAFAPIGVFCLITRTFALEGFSLFAPVIGYLTTISLTLVFHLCVTLMILLYVFAGLNPREFLRKIRSAQVFAFSTSSSNATIPASMQCVTQRVGVDRSVAAFGIPLGATVNMDGTAIMHGVATVFLANVYGMDLGLGGYMTIISISVLASIGTAGVPGVGIVMLAMVLNQLGMPLDGIAIILAVDRILDMMRTVVNITGDAVVTTIVAQKVGKLDRAVFNDPDAGVLAPSTLDVDHEAEAEFASITHKKADA